VADKFLSERNLKFQLYEVLNLEQLTAYPYFEDHSREIFDMVMDTAIRIGREQLWPIFQEMDKKAPELVDGQVRVHPFVRTFMRECGEDGWISAQAPYDIGGQQMPMTMIALTKFIFAAANYSASVYPMLTTGAAHLIESFASEELKETYIPKMFAGEWQGTMALTEPQAGSSLSDITTSAEPTDEGYYRIKGQKIFISAGDHDGVDNVVHLMLAKIKGAPPGVKGISLFVVPKYRPDGSGGLTGNDVLAAGVFHKMGYRGAPITQLSLGENDNCRGWLVGEPHKGLSYMFQMMNSARIEVGSGAAAKASAAYYASLSYAKERPQGRRLTAKDPTAPQVSIIEHPDIKRMLLFQRAVVEGSLAIIMECGMYSDLAKVSEGADREKYALLLDLLTPVAKSYPSEMGVQSVSQGVQILGGYGYVDEFPLEQLYRDVRIDPIHEGTTGIQGLDLLGRKVIMKNGQAFMLYLEELKTVISEAYKDPVLEPYAHKLEEAREQLIKVTEAVTGVAAGGEIERFLADATLYLEFFGIITVAWQWLKQGLAIQKGLMSELSESEANFYQGKFFAMKYFYHYELPKTLGLAERLTEADGLTVEMAETYFED
jgi:alkylation response protein AidB-like acyl-CoA dehydrogenase